MFHRFSASARSTVLRARDIAHSEGQRLIGADHIFLAIVELHPELFERFSNYLIDLQSVQRELAQSISSSHSSQSPTRPRFNRQSKRVMQVAMREARSCWEIWEAPRRKRDQMLPEDQSCWEARLGQPITIARFPKWFVRWRLQRKWEVDERHLLLGLLEDTENPGVAVLVKRGVTLDAARKRLCATTE
jgi:hypothetical protein